MTYSVKISITAALTTLVALIFGISLSATPPAQAVLAPSFQLGAALEFPSDLPSFETSIGRKADIFLWYQSISDSLDTATLKPIAQGGRTIQLAWEPWDYGAPDPVNQPSYQLRDITAGNWDTDIHRWAREIKAFGFPVLFLPMCEMNGDWTSWSGTVNGNIPADYIPAWRHVHDIFVQEEATNAKFGWSPNGDGDAASAAATFNTYYPGDTYVDYLGIDAYNWGTMYKTPSWTSSWQSFEEVFGYSYDAFTVRSTRPIMISETASTEQGGDKAAWITDAFAKLPVRFPRVVSLTWFNYNKETDWRVNSSATSLAAFKTAVAVSDTGGTTPPPPAPAPPPADTTAPTVSFISPLAGATIFKKLTLNAAASDNVSVSRVELYLDGRLISTDAAAPYYFYLNTRKYPAGTHTFTAKAYDSADNVGSASVLVWK